MIKGLKELGCEYFMTPWYRDLGADESRACLSDPEKNYSRREVEELSGKLYNYLQEQGIGTDDFVFIDLPRSSKIFIAMLGVAKAGAAYVVVESNFPKERKEYILQDTKCKLVINEELFSKLGTMKYKKGYEEVDLHDAAFAIYTTGTTGTPKGVVHEYGNYCLLYKSIRDPKTGILRENVDTRFLSIAPFNFIASVMIFGLLFYAGGIVFTPDYDIIKNGLRLVKYMHANKITETFLAPSLIKRVDGKLNPEMKLIYTGSEPATNVAISKPDTELHNLYLMSEALFVLCQREITEPMEITPVGKPNEGIDVSLNSKGEIIVYNQFCRGYLHKEDNKAFKDNYYNTGDVAELNEDGEFVLKGRSSDIIKINGNRVEPLEIEVVASKLLKNKACAAKGFVKGENSYICLYYESKKEIDKKALADQMGEYLPYYMIPSHFVRVDSLPKTKLGKLNRKALREPAVVSTSPYAAPTRDIEKKMCETFQNSLNLEKIGIDDDLFELGLNSLYAIEAMTNLNIDDIQVGDLYTARTVRKLAERYDEIMDTYLTTEEKELIGRKNEYPLSLASTYMNRLQQIIGTTEINMPSAWKLSKIVNVEKLKNAINKCLEESSNFKVEFYKDEEGTFYQRYNPDVLKLVNIEYMTEEEVKKLQKTFVVPFNALKGDQYRIRLIKTKKNAYLFMDFSHVILDGTGLKMFAENFIMTYFGKKAPYVFDYFAHCYDEKLLMDKGYYARNIAHTIKKFEGKNYGTIKRVPGEEVKSLIKEFETGIDTRDIDKYIKKENISRGLFMYTAAALQACKNNGTNDNFIYYLYNNREPRGNQGGCRFLTVLTASRLSKKMDLQDVYDACRNEIADAITHQCSIGVMPEWIERHERLIAINDMGDMLDSRASNPIMPFLAKQIDLERPYDSKPGVPCQYAQMRIYNMNKKLHIKFEVDNTVMKPEYRDQYIKEYISILKRLISGDETLVKECLNK